MLSLWCTIRPDYIHRQALEHVLYLQTDRRHDSHASLLEPPVLDACIVVEVINFVRIVLQHR